MPGDAVDHHEMLLVPVDDTRQRGRIAQLFPRDLDPRRAETDRLRGVADAQQRDPFTRDMTPLAQCLQRVVAAVVLRNDPQRRRAAIHRIELGVVGERHYAINFF